MMKPLLFHELVICCCHCCCNHLCLCRYVFHKIIVQVTASC